MTEETVDVMDVLNEILNEMELNFTELHNALGEIKENQAEIVEKLDNLSLPGGDYSITDSP